MVMIRFRILERITLQGYKADIKEITLAYCTDDNQYYLLEDPIIVTDDKRFRKVNDNEYELIDEDIKTVTVYISKDELYQRYIRSFARNSINPFKLLKLYRQGIISDIPEFNKLLTDITIPDNTINLFINELDRMEKKGKRIVLDVVDILKGIETAYRLYNENRELFEKMNMTMKDIFNDYVNEEEDRLVFITASLFIAFLKTKIEQERAKKEKEEEQIRQYQQQQQQKKLQQVEPKQNKDKVIIPLGKQKVVTEEPTEERERKQEKGDNSMELTTKTKAKEKELIRHDTVTNTVTKTDTETITANIVEIYNYAIYVSVYEELDEELQKELKELVEDFLSKKIKIREVKVYGSQ